VQEGLGPSRHAADSLWKSFTIGPSGRTDSQRGIGAGSTAFESIRQGFFPRPWGTGPPRRTLRQAGSKGVMSGIGIFSFLERGSFSGGG